MVAAGAAAIRMSVVCCLGVAAMAAVHAQDAGEAVALEVILERAGRYVRVFEERFSGVVTEERYQQEATGAWTGHGRAGIASGAGVFGPSGSQSATVRRELVSDFLLVRLPGSDAWLPFRDVFEVDQQRIRDRDNRLAALFLAPEATDIAQARRIMEESARYNVGDIGRTINLPVFALKVLHPSVQARFQFSRERADASLGRGVYVVAYEERSTPTLVHGSDDRDLFSRGRFWIDASTGAVLRSEMVVEDEGLRASVVARYQHDPAYDLAVPVDMREEYTNPEGARITGFATYGRFRAFNVEVADALAKPPRTITDATTGMTLVEVRPGRFTMGSPEAEAGRGPDERQRDAAISRSFFLGQFEVTQQEWRAVMTTTPAQSAQCGATCPVERVSLTDVRRFLDELNARTRDARYRLPTEAEWEYACRAGLTTAYSTGDAILTTQANYDGRGQETGIFRGQPIAAGSLGTNLWGFADMHGNVAEWTDDGFVRGGGWQSDAAGVRCARREWHPAPTRTGTIGFRVAADLIER